MAVTKIRTPVAGPAIALPRSMRELWGSHGREDRWILILLGLLLILSGGVIWLQRKPLCIESRLVDRVEFLHDEGLTTVYRCNLRKEPTYGPHLGVVIQKMNRALAVIDPISREFWPAERRPVTLLVDGREELGSGPDPQAISAADAAQPALLGKAIFAKMVAGSGDARVAGTGGLEANFWVRVSVDMMMEFAFGSWSNGPMARALRPADAGWPISGDADEETRAVMLELVQGAGSPAQWREFLRLIDVLKITTPGPQSEIWGAMSAGQPEAQADANRVAELRTNVMRAHQFIARSGDLELAASIEKVFAGLEKHGLGTERAPLRFDHLFWTGTEALANADGTAVPVLMNGGRKLSWRGARVGRALLPQIIAGESVFVACGWPLADEIRRASLVSNRVLVVGACDKNLKWSAFLRDGVAGFARANPGVPFVQLNAQAARSGKALSPGALPVNAPVEPPAFGRMGLRGDYDAVADFYRVNAAEDTVLAYRLSPKSSRAGD